LGEGLLERVYEQAFKLELQALGIPFVCQQEYPVVYRGSVVGQFRADLVVDNRVLVELKAVGQVSSGMESQLYNYLKLSGIAVGYLFNFNCSSLWYKRIVRGTG
jgi:GxxExxY protein